MINYRLNLVDVKDYLNMQKKGVHSLASWQKVRSLIVNKEGCTISQLISEIDKDFDFNYPPSLNSLELVLTSQ